MILTFSQNPRRVTADTPVAEEVLAMALSSRLAWANVHGRAHVRFRAELVEKSYTDKETGKTVTMPAILEIGDEVP